MNDSHHDISAGLKESWMASEDPCSTLSCLTGNANLVLECSTNENRASLARIRGEVLRKCYGNDIRIKWRMENRETDVEVRVDSNCTRESSYKPEDDWLWDCGRNKSQYRRRQFRRNTIRSKSHDVTGHPIPRAPRLAWNTGNVAGDDPCPRSMRLVRSVAHTCLITR